MLRGDALHTHSESVPRALSSVAQREARSLPLAVLIRTRI